LEQQKREGKGNRPSKSRGGPNIEGKRMYSQGKMGTSNKMVRPNTTAMGKMASGGLGAPPRPFTGVNTVGGMSYTGVNFMQRAMTAAELNPKLRRFENLIFRLKKLLESEKKSLRHIKTLCAKEID